VTEEDEKLIQELTNLLVTQMVEMRALRELLVEKGIVSNTALEKQDQKVREEHYQELLEELRRRALEREATRLPKQ
jgi:hypothetical protein